jgi:nucleoside-diphosphate-sugar epimerase
MNADTAVPAGSRRCLLTGASGYLGRQIKRRLVADGWEVVELTRKPTPGSGARPFRLGAPIDPGTLAGCQALVHCAYDFDQIAWKDIHAVNVLGSERLFQAARQAGVGQLVFISTISAFAGCKSLYGKAKLEIERAVRSYGGWAIRPGLIYGEDTGGMVGRLVAQVRRASLLPIPGSGAQQMYLVHQDDVAEAVSRALAKPAPADAPPVTVAHGKPFAFRAILHELARALGRKVTLAPVPWRLMWLALRSAEICGLRLPLRSDSLVSLVNQDRAPVLNARETLGVECRPFDPGRASLVAATEARS